ncbi:hypothetical protein IFM89_013208 [Coptis chinensis]|uniref:Leucine-rich repeat-containing N-terminal plant-type domain-containing protein n=1 Tax=Coptis chinensis TaxID=261450 RepID=A0A835M5L7_9MAGN|nr:hypothetical protein IFM89_013208 [Coptis chinensis]
MNSWPWTICMFVFFAVFHYNGCLGCLEEERVALWKIKASIKWYHTDCLRDPVEYRIPPFCTWVDDKTSDCCTWERVKCSNFTGRVTELFLQDVSLNSLYTPFDDNTEEYNHFLDVSLYTPFEELQHLDLSNNALNWTIEDLERLSKLKKLEVLDLGHNQFVNKSNNLPSIPTKVIFSNNSEKSTVPFLDEFKSLKTLILNDNKLVGSLSNFAKVLTNLSNLKILNVSGNNFSGRIPPSLWSLNSLEALSLGDSNIKEDSISSTYRYPSHFDGGTYSTLDQYREQEKVDFITKSRSDSYRGDILNYMAGMDLSCNEFTGDIPPELGALIAIRALNFSHNQLTGSIPKSLSDLKQLESMDLSHNKLSGQIPSELIGINTLEVFIVAYNNLSGRVPDKAQFSTFDVSSYEGNPSLCGPPLQKQCNTSKDPVISVTLRQAGLAEKFGIDPISFLSSFAATYVVYLLGFVIVLYVNPNWRGLWFNFIDACLSFIFPFCSK